MNKKKHLAKAAGLKSTFAIDGNKVLMTSFGSGSEAVLEKIITDGKIENCADNLDVKVSEKGFSVKHKNTDKEIRTNNPQLEKEIGEDRLGKKNELEKRYFDKTFKDNIHIQIIYNIMDIEKILSIHVNNAIYALNNTLNRDDKNENLQDLIGSMKAKAFENFKNSDDYETFRQNINKPQMSYFGGAFFETGFNTKAKKKTTDKKHEKDIYYIISLLSYIRQAVAHGYDWNINKDEVPSALYTLDKEYDYLYKNKVYREEARNVLDSLYDSRIDDLNKNFLKNAEKDLTIVFSVYEKKNIDTKKDFIRRYYDFLIKKDYKRLGFSIKKLREIITCENEDILAKKNEILNKKDKTMLARLNRLIDFAIYTYYLKKSYRPKSLVKSLRLCTDDSDKIKVYTGEGEKIYNAIKQKILNILKKMEGKTIASMEPDADISKISLENLKTEDWLPVSTKSHYFVKLIYLLTLFLDGKEINDLVTTLINKTENIASFNKILKEIDFEPEYLIKYSVFKESDNMAFELRALNSFARMEKPDASAKRIMFVEAAKMLGDNGSYEELTKFFDGLFDKNCDNNKKGLRNFIRNNVIESDRFKYLVRYCNVNDVVEFSKNGALIKFVLKQVPQAQILRYYNSCTGKNSQTYADNMLDELSKIIENISFEQFKNVKQRVASDSPDATDKEKKQNVIRLYLTVCYLFFKNLIYVNSRYFLAFYCLERDLKLWGEEGKLGCGEKNISYTTLTKKFMDSDRVRKEPKKNKESQNDDEKKHIPIYYIETNLENADNTAVHEFRNITEHINTVQNAGKYLNDIKKFESYYQIYHYIAQRLLSDRTKGKDISETTKRYISLVNEHGSYCKDFVKALCVPFAYNLPRFKNLSIDGLFDKNDTREKRNTSINS